MNLMQNDFGWTRGEPIWKIGFLTPYPIVMWLGMLLAFLTVVYFWIRQKYSWNVLYIILLIAIPSGILGARLWFGFSDPSIFSSFQTFFHFQGLAIQGGVIFATLAASPYLYKMRNVIDIRTAFGIVFPAVLIGQAIGRWGNFSNHEVFGQIVSGDSLNWLDWLGIKSNMLIEREYWAPLFLYESLATFFGYIVLVWVLLYKNFVKPGTTGALYFIYYGVVRIAMEPLRDPLDILRIWEIPTSIVTSALFIVAGIILFVWFEFFTKPFYTWTIKVFSKKLLEQTDKEYELIKPIKPRRKYIFFGPKSDFRLKYTFFGPKVKNHVNLWIIKPLDVKWSKREINSGAKKPKKRIKSL